MVFITLVKFLLLDGLSKWYMICEMALGKSNNLQFTLNTNRSSIWTYCQCAIYSAINEAIRKLLTFICWNYAFICHFYCSAHISLEECLTIGFYAFLRVFIEQEEFLRLEVHRMYLCIFVQEVKEIRAGSGKLNTRSVSTGRKTKVCVCFKVCIRSTVTISSQSQTNQVQICCS